MRNVIKGYQVPRLAMPKSLMSSMNKEFGSYHKAYSGSPRMYLRKPPAVERAPSAKRPGKNAGIRGGFNTL